MSECQTYHTHCKTPCKIHCNTLCNTRYNTRCAVDERMSDISHTLQPTLYHTLQQTLQHTLQHTIRCRWVNVRHSPIANDSLMNAWDSPLMIHWWAEMNECQAFFSGSVNVRRINIDGWMWDIPPCRWVNIRLRIDMSMSQCHDSFMSHIHSSTLWYSLLYIDALNSHSSTESWLIDVWPPLIYSDIRACTLTFTHLQWCVRHSLMYWVNIKHINESWAMIQGGEDS